MRTKIRLAFWALCPIALAVGLVGYRAMQQSFAVQELFRQERVAIQFSDGVYAESLTEANTRNHFFSDANVVYVDLPRGESDTLVRLLRQLPQLNRIILRYQGESLEEYKRQQPSIEAEFMRLKATMRQAFPSAEILRCSTVVEHSR